MQYLNYYVKQITEMILECIITFVIIFILQTQPTELEYSYKIIMHLIIYGKDKLNNKLINSYELSYLFFLMLKSALTVKYH